MNVFNAEFHYNECHYTGCNYAEIRGAECRGAVNNANVGTNCLSMKEVLP